MSSTTHQDGEPHEQKLHEQLEWSHIIIIGIGSWIFVVGSVFFLYERLMIAGTWLFIIGSVLFALANVLRTYNKLVVKNYRKETIDW